MKTVFLNQFVTQVMKLFLQLNSDLSGFWNNLALHLGRSSLGRSYSYGSAADHLTCFASSPNNSGPW